MSSSSSNGANDASNDTFAAFFLLPVVLVDDIVVVLTLPSGVEACRRSVVGRSAKRETLARLKTRQFEPRRAAIIVLPAFAAGAAIELTKRRAMHTQLYVVLLCTFVAVLVVAGSSEVVDLTSKTFEHLTQAATGHTTGDWLVKFYAPW